MTNHSEDGTPMEATEIIETMALAAASRENLIEICKTLRRQKFKLQDELSAAQSALAEKEREVDQLKRQIQSEIELSRELGEQVVAAEARAGEGWIPVSERLPDVDGIRWMIWVIDNYRMPYLASEYYHFHEGWATDEEVTHWMSLPAPPASPTGRKE